MNAELLWGLLIKGSVVIALAALASLALRKTSAARRHIVWLAALCGLLLLLLAAVRLPSWSVSAEGDPIVAPLMAPMPLRVHALVVAPSVGQVPVVPAVASPTHVDFAQVVTLIWLVGFAAAFVWSAIGLAKVALLIRSGRAWSPDAEVLIGTFSGSTGVPPSRFASSPTSPAGRGLALAASDGLLGLSEKARILLCPSLKIPATAGILRPVVLLPEDAPSWPSDRLRMVLAHESAHIRRRDWLWQILAQAACAVHFFNPLAWLAARRLRVESEFACDDYVIELGNEPTDYAQELLDMARKARFQMASAVGMASSRNVESRLRSIVDRRRNRKSVSGRALVFGLAGCLALIVPVAILRAVPGIGKQGSKFKRTYYATLPPIPWVPSKEVEPNVFLAQDGVAGLKNGIKVKLIGISTDGNANELWGPTGKPVADGDDWRIGAHYWQGRTFHTWSYGEPSTTPLHRGFVVEVESDKDQSVAVTDLLTNPAPVTQEQKNNPKMAGADDRIPDLDLEANQPAYAILDMGIPVRAESGTYRFGVANSDWTTQVEFDHPFGKVDSVSRTTSGTDSCGIDLSAKPVIWYQDSNLNDHRVDLMPPNHKIDSTTARRVLLYDASGRPIELPGEIGYDYRGYPMITLTADTFRTIARVVLQTAPYQWAEFRDLPLRPDYAKDLERRLNPGVRGTAAGIAPGFSKTLSNGVTVSVGAVTRPALDGKNWRFLGQPSWRADGEVLATGPKIDDWPMSTSTWGSHLLVRYQIGYQGISDNANTWVQPTGDIDPTYWLKDQYPRSQPGSQGVGMTEYQAGTKTGGVRVGVAEGPWTTVSTTPIDVPQQPAVTGKESSDPRGPRTGIELTLDDIPTLSFEEGGRQIKLSDHSLRDVAKRFVVVLKSGKEVSLQLSGSGRKGLELFSLPARHGEFNEAYNHILASQVKAIKLETRPYEWAEFTGIALEHR